MFEICGLFRIRFFSSRKLIHAMTAMTAMETPTPTPIAVLLLWDVWVLVTALWVDVVGVLVPETPKVTKVIYPVTVRMDAAALPVDEVVACTELAPRCELGLLVEAAPWEESTSVDAAAFPAVEATVVDGVAVPPQFVGVAAEVV